MALHPLATPLRAARAEGPTPVSLRRHCADDAQVVQARSAPRLVASTVYAALHASPTQKPAVALVIRRTMRLPLHDLLMGGA